MEKIKYILVYYSEGLIKSLNYMYFNDKETALNYIQKVGLDNVVYFGKYNPINLEISIKIKED